MTTLREKLATLLRRKAEPTTCDTCAFVEFFRSNGDGQTARLQAFCRCPNGLFADRPIPAERHCGAWQQATRPAEKPTVGDPNLTV
jgi:hypothetical protein